MPLLLELFSGTGSVGRAFAAAGWRVHSLDINPEALHEYAEKFICKDILQTTPADFEPPTVIWASPLCQFYSAARTHPRSTVEELEFSDSLVRKVLEIAGAFGCPFFMENPRTGKLPRREVVKGIPFETVDYCMFRDSRFTARYRKPTAIWTNTSWKPDRPRCQGGRCMTMVLNEKTGRYVHPDYAQRGGGFSQNDLYKIPPALIETIVDFCQRYAGPSFPEC